MKNIGIFLLLLFFGIPFLAPSDFFPLHRFGMFSRLPVTGKSEFQAGIQIKKEGKWMEFKTGNSYIDNNYFPVWAKKAAKNPTFKKRLRDQLQSNGMAQAADSIRLISQKEGGQIIEILKP